MLTMFMSHCTQAQTSWLKYQHPSIRDLAWLLFSPPLFREALSGFQSFTFPSANKQLEDWLSTLDQHIQQAPEAYSKILRNKYQRLGLYCESLFEFALTEGGQAGVLPFQQLARNIQIQSDSKTIGECDVIAKDQHDHFLHIEIAIKFYLLGNKDFNEWSSWIGPNSIDRLDIKLNRLLQHQLKILRHPAANHHIEALRQQWDIRSKLQSLYFLKGYLFYPLSEILSDNNIDCCSQLPQRANPTLLRAYWMRYQEFFSVLNKYQVQVRFCHKMDWLTGNDTGPIFTVPQEIRQYIEKSHQVAQSYSNKTPALLLQGDIAPHIYQAAIMLVPDYWPATNMPSRKI